MMPGRGTNETPNEVGHDSGEAARNQPSCTLIMRDKIAFSKTCRAGMVRSLRRNLASD